MATTLPPLHYQKYVNDVLAYTDTQAQYVSSNCNSITFWNKGTSTIILKNVIPLAPNDFISFGGDDGELDVTQYNYKFTGAGTQLMIVLRKMYVEQ